MLRDYVCPRGVQHAPLSLYDLNGMDVNLYKADGTLVQTKSTGATSNHRAGGIQFTELEPGTYYLEVDAGSRSAYQVLPYSQLRGNGEATTQTEWKTSEFEVAASGQIASYRWVLVNTAFDLQLHTEVGTFKDESNTKEYFTKSCAGESYAREDYPQGFPPAIFNSNGNNLYSALGVLYGDSPSLSSLTKEFEQPFLSEEEWKKGYEFLGWKTDGTKTLYKGNEYAGREVLSPTDAAGIKIYKHTDYYAAWRIPELKLRFLTNNDMGTIAGTTEYTVLGKGSTVEAILNEANSSLPTVTAKEGYEFVGWFENLTFNKVEDKDILSFELNQDKDYFALYKKKDVDPEKVHRVTFIGNTDPEGKGLVSGKQSAVQKVPDGDYLTVPEVSVPAGYKLKGWKDAEGNEYTTSELLAKFALVEGDLTFEAVYEAVQPADDPTPAPTPTPTPNKDCGCTIIPAIAVGALIGTALSSGSGSSHVGSSSNTNVTGTAGGKNTGGQNTAESHNSNNAANQSNPVKKVLATTGAHVWQVALIAVVLLFLGIFLVRAAQKRK